MSAGGDVEPSEATRVSSSRLARPSSPRMRTASESPSRSTRPASSRNSSSTSGRPVSTSRRVARSRAESPPAGRRLPKTVSRAPVRRPSSAAESGSACPLHRRMTVGGGHRAERPGAVEVAREEVHQALAPELELWGRARRKGQRRGGRRRTGEARIGTATAARPPRPGERGARPWPRRPAPRHRPPCSSRAGLRRGESRGAHRIDGAGAIERPGELGNRWEPVGRRRRQRLHECSLDGLGHALSQRAHMWAPARASVWR